jgi:hypothetical protein
MHGDAVERRFWDKVRIGDGCWEWTAGLTHNGYGRFKLNGKTRRAHQVAWELWNGALFYGNRRSADLEACHSCNNPRCVRPSHVSPGSHAVNVAYMVAQGRQAKGETHMSRTKPESLARGDKHGLRLHPERAARGDRNGSRLYPERRPRGDSHVSRSHPEVMPRGVDNGNSRLDDALVREIRRRHELGESGRSLSIAFGVAPSTIFSVIRRETWRHVL